MYIVIGILAVSTLFTAAKYFLLRGEVKRLHQQINSLYENAAYGKRLYLEEYDAAMAKAINAINRMVDAYEGKLKRVGEMESNIRHSISCISHDLRTPLTSLTGYLQLLSKEGSPAKQREYFDIIFHSTAMLRDLTENFYELSRLDLEDNTLSIQSLSLVSIVCECFLSFYENFAQQDMNLTLHETNTPLCALADTVALKRVLYNVIQNLLRYAKKEISVSFAEEDGYVAVTIHNDRAYDTPIQIDRVFERFYTADVSRNGRSRGLGLYISQKLIAGMNGKMTAKLDATYFCVTIELPKA